MLFQAARRKCTLPPLYPTAVADYKAKVPVRDIAAKYGYCTSSIYRLLRFNEVKLRIVDRPSCKRCGDPHKRKNSEYCGQDCELDWQPKVLSNPLAKRIRYHLSLGYSMNQIAKNLGKSIGRISRVHKYYCGKCGSRYSKANGTKWCPKGCSK
jgi:IS30 family transposase